ncbi:MAG: FAD-dependent oxidoreductase [Ignavibacteriaceae bacterium]|nr:FAD-dependent oxidoreductase [Ignavibacteriaceae bacterium]
MRKGEKIIIVGGNAAGPAAGAKAKRVNPDAEVILFEAGDYISTGTCEIPYVLSNEIKNTEDIIFFNVDRFYAQKGVKVYVNHFVEEINTREKIVKARNLKDNSIADYNYDKLILATGSTVKKESSLKDAENSFTLKTISDLVHIRKYIEFNKVRNVVIIGSGYIGLETAEALVNLGCSSVSLVEKAAMPFPSAEPEIQALIKELLIKYNIDFYPTAEIKPVFNNNKINAVNINGRAVATDLVISAIGFSPNIYLAVKANLKLGTTGALMVDTRLRTSDFNIYAAGDLIEVTDFVTGRPVYIPFASYAYEHGHIAGENAAGGNVSVSPVIKNSGLRLFDKYYASVGMTTNEAEGSKILIQSVTDIQADIASVMPGAGKVFGKIVFERLGSRILGASFFGGREVEGFVNVVSTLIKLKQPAHLLAELNYIYTPPLSPLKNLLSSLGKKIKSIKK